jgi:pyridinium-3,5-bisthiocarboxylic acid mononucleotide nickel chelatase
MTELELRGGHLHFDCASGAAGDMVLAALLDLGVPEEVVRDALDRVGVGGWRLGVARVVKGGIAAVDVKVDDAAEQDAHEHDRGDAHPHAHPHAHSQDHGHAHVHYRDIEAMLRAAGLEPAVEGRALDIFGRIARAEAKLHGSTVERVAFHEVGAIDSIVDVVGVAAALEWLAPTSVSAVSVAMGHGTITCAHGVLPVPSPAALEVLREAGAVTTDGGVARELCTPTGAAILASAVTRWGPMPELVVRAIGYGAGDADLPDRANVVRLVAGRPAQEEAALYRLEANVDDMSPEMCEHAAEALVAAGAIDVWWTPIAMKKSRPALLLSALAPQTALDAVSRAALRETTTLGVRFDPVARRTLARRVVEVETAFGPVPVKIASLDGEVVNAAPEYEACREAARRHGVPLKRVYAAAVAAYERS